MKELTIQATEVFQKNYNATKRFVVNIGGSRSTKTYSILQLLIVRALSSEKPLLISIVRKSFPSARITVMRDFFDILKNLDLYDDNNWNGTEKSYQLGSSTIEFFSIDDPQKRRGSKRNILYINEANELTSEDFFQLQIRTTDQIFIDFNPSEYFWYNEQLESREDVEVIRSTYKDNPYLNEAQIKEIERLQFTDQQYYQIYALGQFAGDVDLVYSHNIVDDIPTDVAKLIGLGLDWGYSNDPTTLIEVWKHEDNLYLNEILYDTNLTNSDIADKMKEAGVDRYMEIVADSAEPKSIEEVRRMGFNIKPAYKGPDSVNNGIDILKRHKIYVTKDSANLIHEFRRYKWITDKDGNKLNKPIDAFNHGLDAVRYVALNKLKEQKKGAYAISIVSPNDMPINFRSSII